MCVFILTLSLSLKEMFSYLTTPPDSPWPFPDRLAARRTSLFLEHTSPWPRGADKVARSKPHKTKQREGTTVFWPQGLPTPTKENRREYNWSSFFSRYL